MDITENQVAALGQRGVNILAPDSVFVAADVDLKRISPDVTVYPGCRILGSTTSIGAGAKLGQEAPVTIEDCQLGDKVELKGGYVSGATFLDGANMGSGAHIRPGTILEEEANGAHSVGLKQTIFLPFVTAGSLINFCDVLMAGGLSRRIHSEIGSSYIHFNFTPHGDKATPSLIGDVPRGVMLDQPPIFLGGQGGLVGPVRIGFGAVVAAGGIQRKDVLEDGQLVIPQSPRGRDGRVYDQRVFGDVRRVVKNNLHYIGNLKALLAWYRLVRVSVMKKDEYSSYCYDGALVNLERVMDERIKRLANLKDLVSVSLELLSSEGAGAVGYTSQAALLDQWPVIEEGLAVGVGSTEVSEAERFVSFWASHHNDDYVESIQTLPDEVKLAGTTWLRSIVQDVVDLFTYNS